MKKILTSPSFWLLLSTNIYLVYYYDRNPASFATLIWIYWFQNILVGLFSFAELVSSKKITQDGRDIPVDQPVSSSLFYRPGCLALFFLFHYMGFQLAYFFFLLTSQKPALVDRHLLLWGIFAFAIGLLTEFIPKKSIVKSSIADIGQSFLLPYLRIVPMHLMIVGPAFLGWKASTIFLVLKTIADTGMYVITSQWASKMRNYKGSEPDI